MASRTTLILDDQARAAARQLARRYGCSLSEAMRRALVRQRDAEVGVPRERRRERARAVLLTRNARDFTGIPGLRAESAGRS